MLWEGPPKIVTVGVPCTVKALFAGFVVGFTVSNTTIGIGDVDCDTPHTAIARTLCFVAPFSIPAKKVGILSVIVTCMKAVGAIPAGGVVTPGTLAGKVTETLFPREVFPDLIELPKPLNLAYWHGDELGRGLVSDALQPNAVPALKPPWPVMLVVASTSRSMAPATH